MPKTPILRRFSRLLAVASLVATTLTLAGPFAAAQERNASESAVADSAAAPAPDAARILGRIRGHVYGAEGAASNGADVRLTRLDPVLGPLSYSTMRSTRSAADGTFLFSAIEPGSYLVDARDGESWLRLPRRVVVDDDGTTRDDVRLTLEPGCSIAGRVTDEEGRPLQGVSVSVGDAGMQAVDVQPVTVVDDATGAAVRLPESSTYPRLPLAVTITDAEGRFRLAPVLPSSGTSVRVGGLSAYYDTTVEDVVTRPGRTCFVDVTMRRGVAVTGRALDPDGRPAASARVTLRTIEHQPQSAAWIVLTRTGLKPVRESTSTTLRTDADGAYRFDGLVPGRYLVRAEYPGAAPFVSAILVITRPGEVYEQQIRFQGGRQLHGLVSDADGLVPEDCVVRIVRDGSVPSGVDDFLDPVEATLAADGSFVLDRLGAGPFDVEIESPRYATVVMKDVDLDKGMLAVELGKRSPFAGPVPLIRGGLGRSTVSAKGPRPGPPATKKPYAKPPRKKP